VWNFAPQNSTQKIFFYFLKAQNPPPITRAIITQKIMVFFLSSSFSSSVLTLILSKVTPKSVKAETIPAVFFPFPQDSSATSPSLSKTIHVGT